MKKLLLTMLCSISACAYSEVNTHIYNNYIALSGPQYAPNSKLIKRQEISSSFFDEKLNKIFSEKLIIESNNEGLITLVSYDDNRTHNANYLSGFKKQSLLGCYSDITKQTCDFGTFSNIVYNQDKNIEKITAGATHHQIYGYDDKQRLNSADLTISLSPNNYRLIKDFNYTDYNKVEYLIEKYVDLKPYGNYKYSIYRYDDYNSHYNHRIMGVRTVIYGIDEDLQMIENENKKTISSMFCSFSDHNEYDDWTKGSCSNEDEDIGNITRTIEYW